MKSCQALGFTSKLVVKQKKASDEETNILEKLKIKNLVRSDNYDFFINLKILKK